MSDPVLLVSESWNLRSPYFQWMSPAVEGLPGTAISLPVIEAVNLLGHEVFRQTLVRIVDELRPDVLWMQPPLDFLDAATCAAVRERGTRLVGWLDSELKSWGEARFDALGAQYDRLLTPCRALAAREAEVLWLPWTLAEASVEVADPAAPTGQVALIAPHRPEREELARALATAGYEILAYGPRWAMGDLVRPSRLGLMGAVDVVLTFADQPLQLVEAARLGVRQLVERGEEVDAVLPDEGGPATFSSIEECLARLAEPPPEEVWQGVPGWTTTLPAALAGLALPGISPTATPSPTLSLLHAAVAHSYEQGGFYFSARAGYRAWGRHCPELSAPLAGEARVALLAEDYEGAAEKAEEALRRCPETGSVGANLPLFLRGLGPGGGLGRSMGVDQRTELRALLCTALVEGERLFDAVEEIRPLCAAERRAVHGAFVPKLENTESLLFDRMLSGEEPLPPAA